MAETNGTPGSHPFTVKDATVENFRPLRVVVVGAGYSGIYLGIRIPELLHNVDLTIYEKHEGVGGVWWANRYPGCACDIPAHSYVYTFEPNPDWSSFYAPSPEIHAYLDKVANKYSAKRFMKFSHEVVGCFWDNETFKWKLQVKKLETGEIINDEADIVINARGPNHYIWPEIDGLWSFKGKVVHSAGWDPNFDYSNKRIGIIGTGSSAIQIVPQMQKLPGADLKLFARSKTWIATGFGDSAMAKLGLDHETFTKEDHDKYMADPEKYHLFRKTIETEVNSFHAFSLKDHPLSQGSRAMFTDLMRQRLAKKPELADQLIPSFAPGCRRLTPGPGFLEALTEDNVEFITDTIRSIDATGLVLDSGRKVDVDVIVCATGFNAVGAPPYPIVGLEGKTIQDRYKPVSEAYLSVAIDGFPNLFTMLGPNSGVASGSLTKIIESLGDYIIKCVRKMQKEDIAAMHVKPIRVRNWNDSVTAYFKRTVFLDECNSWYKRGDRVLAIWPGSTVHAIETLRSPRWEDFEYLYSDEKTKENPLAWVGNGWSETQLEGHDVAYYIEPEFVDFPEAPFPEKTKRWAKVAFSH